MKKAIFIILSAFILSCGNSGGSDSPMNAVKDFVTAIKEGNYNKAWGELNIKSKKFFDNKSKERNSSGRDYFEKFCPDVKSLGILGTDFTIVDQKQDGDIATVVIKTSDGNTSDIYTEKEGNTWKLDYIKSVQESINPETQ